MADFIDEFTHKEELKQGEKKHGENSLDGAGMVVITSEGIVIERAMTLGFIASNNEAEYGALLLGLETAKDLRIRRLTVHRDSQLVANQLTGSSR